MSRRMLKLLFVAAASVAASSCYATTGDYYTEAGLSYPGPYYGAYYSSYPYYGYHPYYAPPPPCGYYPYPPCY